jgi:SPFH domain/Band 7 family protein
VFLTRCIAICLETSLLFQLDPMKAADIYRTVGSDYIGTIVEPQFRSAIREITASYEAKALYSAEREKIATEIFSLFRRLCQRARHRRAAGAAQKDRVGARRGECDSGKAAARARRRSR